MRTGNCYVFNYLQTNSDIDLTNLLIEIVNDIRKEFPGIDDMSIGTGLLKWLDFMNNRDEENLQGEDECRLKEVCR